MRSNWWVWFSNRMLARTDMAKIHCLLERFHLSVGQETWRERDCVDACYWLSQSAISDSLSPIIALVSLIVGACEFSRTSGRSPRFGARSSLKDELATSKVYGLYASYLYQSRGQQAAFASACLRRRLKPKAPDGCQGVPGHQGATRDRHATPVDLPELAPTAAGPSLLWGLLVAATETCDLNRE